MRIFLRPCTRRNVLININFTTRVCLPVKYNIGRGVSATFQYPPRTVYFVYTLIVKRYLCLSCLLLICLLYMFYIVFNNKFKNSHANAILLHISFIPRLYIRYHCSVDNLKQITRNFLARSYVQINLLIYYFIKPKKIDAASQYPLYPLLKRDFLCYPIPVVPPCLGFLSVSPTIKTIRSHGLLLSGKLHHYDGKYIHVCWPALSNNIIFMYGGN